VIPLLLAFSLALPTLKNAPTEDEGLPLLWLTTFTPFDSAVTRVPEEVAGADFVEKLLLHDTFEQEVLDKDLNKDDMVLDFFYS